ncbi:hypothetical protein A1O3_00342 [Capronia epimyces CBS 606.96]|uniref:Uncharacterized protein n=1 Tax=Capronia epimyces CBS 606.96 TaxID=1182542 RepID=W9YFX8_9EURO|nr:uncharacterized protein A1O3_00342 [Capronia epimyces CBS 606.96]EXJ91792.1 hypothetical protein A1O3_00342 [Capronia epimyces CBS 606.96]
MDSTMPQFLMTLALSTTPQQAFEQADALLVQASMLHYQAAQLESQVDTINERAEILITTASGLRVIAEQDRESIQYLFDSALETYQNDVAAYEKVPHQAERLRSVKARVEDGMVTIEELEALLEDMVTLTTPKRSDRSLAPEPESPPSPLTTMPLLFPAGVKRGRSASEEEEQQAGPSTKKVKREIKRESSQAQEKRSIAQDFPLRDEDCDNLSDIPLSPIITHSSPSSAELLENSRGQTTMTSKTSSLTTMDLHAAMSETMQTADSDSSYGRKKFKKAKSDSTKNPTSTAKGKRHRKRKAKEQRKAS